VQLQQGDGGEQERIVGECGEELRRQDGVEAAVHLILLYAVDAGRRRCSLVARRESVLRRPAGGYTMKK
jgi:hypothetical protein